MVRFIRVTSLYRLMLLRQNNIHMEILTSVLTSRLSGVLMMQSAEMRLTVIKGVVDCDFTFFILNSV